ncbi:MAG: hypothetical protein JST54_08650 [Deltaproteobacteria bacterium]|nr:hypothetical protein [Deltaproteobacteria bacterium]
MSRNALQLARRVASEFLLAAYALGVSAALVVRVAVPEALVATVLGLLVAGRALLGMSRAGSLRLAWRYPRVDALGLAPPTDALGWRVAEAAEAVLAALDGEANAYRDFFPNARRDVRAALALALDPRAQSAEVEAVEQRLGEIEARLRSARPTAPVGSGLGALELLDARSHALASAVEELAPRSNVVPIRSGGRS